MYSSMPFQHSTQRPVRAAALIAKRRIWKLTLDNNFDAYNYFKRVEEPFIINVLRPHMNVFNDCDSLDNKAEIILRTFEYIKNIPCTIAIYPRLRNEILKKCDEFDANINKHHASFNEENIHKATAALRDEFIGIKHVGILKSIQNKFDDIYTLLEEYKTWLAFTKLKETIHCIRLLIADIKNDPWYVD